MYYSLLNKFGKRNKMCGLQGILLLFDNMFNKFNNTGPPMLDSIHLQSFYSYPLHYYKIMYFLYHFVSFIFYRNKIKFKLNNVS